MNIDLQNIEGLDEEFSCAADPLTAALEVLSKGTEAIGKGLETKGHKLDLESKTMCKRPSVFAGRKKKQAYNDCLQGARDAPMKEAQSRRKFELEKIRIDSDEREKNRQFQKEKISGGGGLKPIFYIGIGLIVLIGGLVVYKKFIVKK